MAREPPAPRVFGGAGPDRGVLQLSAQVIGISQLRKKYESFEAKRNLCNQFDVFLADDRVLPSLPKLIGKSFFRAKKQPIPVNVRGDNWANEVRKSLSGTFMVLPQGSCLNIKVALATQSEDAIVENVDAALKAACEKIPKASGMTWRLRCSDQPALWLRQAACLAHCSSFAPSVSAAEVRQRASGLPQDGGERRAPHLPGAARRPEDWRERRAAQGSESQG